MSMKNFFECQIAVNVLINFSPQIRSLLIVNFDADIFSCKKHAALEILNISGENNGKLKCSSRMAAIIKEVF